MPGMNRTGPEGLGPMTGRRMGLCNEARGAMPGCGFGRGFRNGYGAAYGAGRGFGPGMGRSVGPGRGLGWFRAGYDDAGYGGPETSTAEEIKAALKDRAAFLRAELARTEALIGAPKSGAEGGATEDEGT